MPELPEVETIRRQLEPILVGQTIDSIEVLREKSWDGDISQIVGAEIVAVKRKAKMLFIELHNQKISKASATSASLSEKYTNYLIVHLKMTGQLIYDQDGSDKTRTDRIVGGHPTNSWTAQLPDKHTRIIIKLSHGILYFNDQRVFGWIKTITSEAVARIIEALPPDIIDESCDADYLYRVLQSSRRPIKLVILDSQKIGGVGNIYANDGLFDAGIDPRRPANTLSRAESDQLLESLKKVVNLGINLGGATAADGKFVNTHGWGGSYQNHFLVYEQEGKTIERNGTQGTVEKFKLGGRGTYWVPELQK